MILKIAAVIGLLMTLWLWRQRRFVFRRFELKEASIVTIPANPFVTGEKWYEPTQQEILEKMFTPEEPRYFNWPDNQVDILSLLYPNIDFSLPPRKIDN